MKIERTPKDAGLQTEIKIVAYDNGMMMVNGIPVRGTRNWPMAFEVVVAMVNYFYTQVERPKAPAPAETEEIWDTE